jgi:hypothetical protein
MRFRTGLFLVVVLAVLLMGCSSDDLPRTGGSPRSLHAGNAPLVQNRSLEGPKTQPASVGTEALFSDVPADHWAVKAIEELYRQGYLAGCGQDPLRFCPDQVMSRPEAAVFILRGAHGADFLPASPVASSFVDVPLEAWYARWVQALWEQGYTTGCGSDSNGGLQYCPWQTHTRAEATVLFLRLRHGVTYEPPAPSAQNFGDVQLDAWYARWVYEAQRSGLIEGCEANGERSDNLFRPEAEITRAEAACMLQLALSR